MGRAWMLSALAVAMAVGCGVPEQKYKAALADAQRATKDTSEQRERAGACEQRLNDAIARADASEKHATELSARLAQLEQTASAASADAAQQRDLATRLEQEKTELQKKSAEYESLASSLNKEIKAGRIQLSELQGKVTVRMAEKVLFPSGSANVSVAGRDTLKAIADAFKEVKRRIIRVEGHTDNVGIHTGRFPSNWELSAARAIAVVRLLQQFGVDPTLLGAAGYGEYQPIAANDTPEGRSQNRRIEISLAAPPTSLPQTTSAQQDVPGAAAGSAK